MRVVGRLALVVVLLLASVALPASADVGGPLIVLVAESGEAEAARFELEAGPGRVLHEVARALVTPLVAHRADPEGSWMPREEEAATGSSTKNEWRIVVVPLGTVSVAADGCAVDVAHGVVVREAYTSPGRRSDEGVEGAARLARCSGNVELRGPMRVAIWGYAGRSGADEWTTGREAGPSPGAETWAERVYEVVDARLVLSAAGVVAYLHSEPPVLPQGGQAVDGSDGFGPWPRLVVAVVVVASMVAMAVYAVKRHVAGGMAAAGFAMAAWAPRGARAVVKAARWLDWAGANRGGQVAMDPRSEAHCALVDSIRR